MYENDLSIQVKIFKNSFQQLQITNYLIQMRLEDRMYQQDKVRELNKYEDILDVFIHIVMIRLPTAFTLINMILIIWLVQTIFSSLNADLIPRSLLFYAPLMAAHPIVDISFAEGSCSYGYEQVILKTFPTLTAESIRRANLTKWRQQKHICVKRVDKEINLTINCSNSETYCSGLCVNERSQCPITGIKKVNSIELVLPDQQVFYNSSDHLYKYVISRQSKNTYIIGISAQFQYQCANQYKYYETFPDFNAYWKTVKECGKQGSLSSQSFHPFDSYPTVEFLFANGLWSESMNNSETVHSITTLGYISNIQYKNKQTMCTDVESKAKILSNKILQKPLQPLFSKSLLIISFVFFTVCWAWLLVLYCCQAETVFKNTFVILLAIIQFITIAFIYYENLQQFQLQSLVELVSNCVDQNMPAFENWSFGLSNRSPLISIMFACCTFVLLESVSYFFHYFIYEVYSFQRIDSMFGSISYSSYIHEQDLN